MKRPTFFLSSTIFDFRDLRGAIKHTLEARGCRVLASEYNDFQKPLDRHSYDACLSAIEQADYFLLLIGNRVGGWYDKGNQISITQQEYRTAYRLQRAGKIRIITFVRSEVWQFRSDYKALQEHLSRLELEKSMASSILGFPNRTVEDAAFLVKFIEEVAKNKETALAVATGGELPGGNWVHVFQEYADLHRVLETLLLSGLPLEEAAFKRALRHELIEVLRSACIKSESGEAKSPRDFVEEFDNAFAVPNARKYEPVVAVPAKAWWRFVSVMIHWVRGGIRCFVVRQALLSSAFLEFDLHTGEIRETAVYRALFRLMGNISQLNEAINSGALEVIFQTQSRSDISDREYLEIATDRVLMLIGVGLGWVNVVELAAAIIAHLDGAPFIEPRPERQSPIKGLDLLLEAERPSGKEVQEFVANYVAAART